MPNSVKSLKYDLVLVSSLAKHLLSQRFLFMDVALTRYSGLNVKASLFTTRPGIRGNP